MNAERATADTLDGLAGEVLAADPANTEEVVEIGAALEKALTGEGELTAAVGEALAGALEALQAIYEGEPADPSAAMDAVAVVIAAAAQHLREPDDPAADVAEAAERLGALVSAAGAETASEAPDVDEPQAVPEQVVPPAEAGAPETPECTEDTEDRAAGPPDGENRDDLSAASTSGSQERGAATGPDPPVDQSGPADAAPPRLPEDADLDLLREFVVECLDHISGAEAALLELESNPDDVEQVNTIFRAFHTIKGTSGFLGVDRIQRLAHLAENLLDRARDGEIRIVGGYADVALDSCDALRTMIEGLDGVEPGGALVLPETYEDLIEQLSDPEAAGIGEDVDTEAMRTGDILVGKGQVDRSAVEQAAKTQGGRRIGEALVQAGAASASDVADALRTQKKMRGKAGEATVRVGTGRLDSLIDAVGELVIAQSMVAQDPAVTGGANPQLVRNTTHADKIVRELQDVSMSLRMVPLKATFGKMARLVRDLARKAGKKVRFVTEGEDTEIDRNMVEVLNDPLVHMMRNAVDHGVEVPERRAAAGKDPAGTVRLQAYHSAGNVVIELTDDGKGIDRDRVVAKGIERGLIGPGETLSDADAFGLIFRAGFSTAEKVTDVSGRGVGMDVVRTGIESLRGRVEVASRPGAGSTFTIRLPLTMAIADAMLVRLSDRRYLLPVTSIERNFRPEAQSLSTVAGRGEMVMVRGELLPIFRLYELFDVPGAQTDPGEALLIIIHGEGKRCALMVDQLLGQQQVVVKSLGRSLGQIPGVSGGAILGDGRVGLILDAAGLMKLASGETGGDGLVAAAA